MYKDYIVLRADGISLVGQLFLPEGSGPFSAVCLCHGFPSGSPPDPADGGYPVLAERFCKAGYAVLIFNFRGTGDSGGNLDIQGWARDLETAIDYLWSLESIDKSSLALVGYSAGAATSVYVAARDERVSSVAACACPADFSLFYERNDPQGIVDFYRGIGAIRDEGFPASAQGWIDSFAPVTPEEHAGAISPRPLLIVHGTEDETVPLEHARRLYERAGEPKEIVILEGAGHRLRQEERAINAIMRWMGSR